MINAPIFRLPSKPSTEIVKIKVKTYANLYRNRLQLVFFCLVGYNNKISAK